MSNALQPVAPAPIEKQPKIIDLLQSPKNMERMKSVIPSHLTADKMIRVSCLAIQKTPKLGLCDPASLLGAIVVCGSLGLEPNTVLGHAYLIPFEKSYKENGQWKKRTEVNLIVGYKGFVDLARRSGCLVSIHADVVYDGDEFSFEYGSNQHIRHVPKGERDENKAKWAYAYAKLTDGEAFEVLPYAEVLKIRNKTQGYHSWMKKDATDRRTDDCVWMAYPHEMAAKTMIRRLAKYLPLSTDFVRAAAMDARAETGRLDFSVFDSNPDAVTDIDLAGREPEPVDPPVSLADTLKTKAEAVKGKAKTMGTHPDTRRAELVAFITKVPTKADLANLSSGELETLDLLRDGDPGPDIISTGRLETLWRVVSEV